MNIHDQILLQKEYKISAEEVFFLRLLLLAQPEEDKPEFIYEYFQFTSRGNPREMLLNFQELGILNKSYKIPGEKEKFYPANVEFNKNFLKKFFAYSGDLGFELWRAYPDLLNVRGINFTAKNISKKFNSMEEFFFAYGKAIRFSPTEHKEVLESLEWAIKNNLIRSGIVDYVISQLWHTHKKLRDNGFDGNNLEIDELL
jgi:hypothetical protein